MENQKGLLGRLLDNLLDNLSQRSDTVFDARFNGLKEKFDELHATVKAIYEKSKFWGMINNTFGFLSITASLFSFVLTFSEDVTLIRLCSFISVFSMAVILQFQPSEKESYLLKINKFYQSMEIDISGWEASLKSATNDNLKENILKEFANNLKTLTEMINTKEK